MPTTLKRTALAGVVVAAALAATAVPASADAGTLFSPNATDGWGQDGTAWAVAITGSTVYVGGSFTHAVHNAQAELRTNLMAVTTNGDLLPFAATTDAAVRAIATMPDGSFFIGGDFTMVNNTPRSHLAKFDAAGNLTSFSVAVPKTVRDLLVIGDKLYLAGDFGKIGPDVRKYAAAVDAGSGALDPTFTPTFSGKTYALAYNGTTLYVGGNFVTVNSSPRSYLAGLNAVNGSLQGPVFRNVGDVILDLSVNPDGSQVFGAGGGGFNSAAAWGTGDGIRQWVQRADGDVQAVRFARKNGTQGVGNVYFGFHDGFGGNPKLRLLAADAAFGTLMWPVAQPASGGVPGVVAIDSDGSRLVTAGKFPKMGTAKVKGLSIQS